MRIKNDVKGVDVANVTMSANPLDEIAAEEAVRLKKKSAATEIVAVSCGAAQCQETLRTAIAIGTNRAILIEVDAALQPLAVAKLRQNDRRAQQGSRGADLLHRRLRSGGRPVHRRARILQ